MTSTREHFLLPISPIKLRETRAGSAGRALHIQKPPVYGSDLQFEQALECLKQEHTFLRLKSGLRRSQLKVCLSDSLLKLICQRSKGKAIVILTTEILEIDFGLSPSVDQELIANDCFSNAYGFRIITAKRVLELSSSNRTERENWVSSMKKLLESAKNWADGPLNYANLLLKIQADASELHTQTKTFEKYNRRIQKMQSYVQEAHREIVHETLMQVLAQVERNALKASIGKAEREIKAKTPAITRMETEIDESCRQLSWKNDEIQELSETVEVLQAKIILVAESLSWNTQKSKLWEIVLSYACFEDLAQLRQVSKFFKNLVGRFLKNQDNWKTMTLGTLFPRRIAWKFYTNSFYRTEIPTSLHEISCESLMHLRQCVKARASNKKEKVEEVLINLCAISPRVGFCEGMELVVHYLLNMFEDTSQVIKLMLTLLKPPYSVWSAENTKLKVVNFQVKYMAKLKVPLLYQHFKATGIRISDVIGPWIRSLFICLLYEQCADPDSICFIWDIFIVNNWNGFVAAVLGLLDFSQHSVLGENKERTLQVYKRKMDLEDFKKNVWKFEIRHGMLDDLEKSYFLNNYR